MSKNNDEDKKPANVAKHMLFGAVSGVAFGCGVSIVMHEPGGNNITRNLRLLFNRFNNEVESLPPNLLDLDRHMDRQALKTDMLQSAALFATAGALAGLYTARKKNQAPESEKPWQNRIKTEEQAPSQTTPAR